MGAPKARVGKNGGQNRRAASIFLHGNRIFKPYFQLFFACGALNLQRYQICEPTPYTTILREPTNAAEGAILHYKMYILGIKYSKKSPAALRRGEKYI